MRKVDLNKGNRAIKPVNESSVVSEKKTPTKVTLIFSQVLLQLIFFYSHLIFKKPVYKYLSQEKIPL